MTEAWTVPLANVARLFEDDSDPENVLERLVRLAVDLVPGCTGAALTVVADRNGLTAATSHPTVQQCHEVQFEPDGEGPAREALERQEPRRMDDVTEEDRWPRFRETARQNGFASCLALPLRADRLPPAALNLYSGMSRAFAGTTHDVALLFALQGSVALDNAELYARAHNVVEQLHRTLESRSMIERAKGLLMGSEGLTSQEAFERLRARSQSEHRKLREVALSLLEAHDPGGASGAPAPWVPSRQRPFG